MVSFGPPEPEGTLIVVRTSPTTSEVFFRPDEQRLSQVRVDSDEEQNWTVRILTFDQEDLSVTIEPKNTLPGHDNFLCPKYDKIEQIRIRLPRVFSLSGAPPDNAGEVIEALSYLPSAFTKNPDYGLGLAHDYRFVIDAVEELSDCRILYVTNDDETRVDEVKGIFYISASDFEGLRKSINRISDLGRSAVRAVKNATAYNLLADKIGRESVEVNGGRHPIRRMITAKAMDEEVLQEEEQAAVLNMLSQSAKAMDAAQAERLVKLHHDIELVTLDVLIERYKDMLGKSLTEDHWQVFFNDNPFILNMVFGYPVVKVKDQAFVGGRKVSGTGDKITDFLVKNSLTNNTAIIEIKTPQTDVLNKRQFRDGVFTPSADLSGSINQALDQKYQFQKQIATIKDTSRLYDIETYAVHCCLIVGQTPVGEDQKKSFELFRRNSKDVEIVTFDELLEKLVQLRAFLGSTDKA